MLIWGELWKSQQNSVNDPWNRSVKYFQIQDGRGCSPYFKKSSIHSSSIGGQVSANVKALED